MKILKVIHGYPPHYQAGSEVYSKTLCDELIGHGHSVAVFTRTENPFMMDFEIAFSIQNGIKMYHINMAREKDGFHHPKVDLEFEKIISDYEPDVCHFGHINHLSTGLIKVAKKQNIPILFTLHDFWLLCPRGQFVQTNFGESQNYQVCDSQEDNKCASNCYRPYFASTDDSDSLSDWTKWVEKRMKATNEVLALVDRFIAPSEYLLNKFLKHSKVDISSKTFYLDYGFKLDKLKAIPKPTSSSSFTFGYIGTHTISKGIHLLIEAFKYVNNNAKLVIWGKENHPITSSLKEKSHGLNIEFRGEYKNEEISNKVFTEIDCLVVPSIWEENSPLVIHEALQCKIPIITSNIGGMSEFIHDEVNGLLFSHRNRSSLTEKMIWAIENQQKLHTMASKGYLKSNDGQIPSIEEHTKAILTHYSEIISKNIPLNFWRLTLDTNPEDCNAQCIMCEEHSPFSTFKQKLYNETGIRKRRMSGLTLQNAIKQAKELGITEIIPSTMGEPLIYKEFDNLIDLCNKNNLKLNITTNGSFPRKSVEEWAHQIIPITTDVKISWNGSTKELYESIMLNLEFDKAMDNLIRFIAIRDNIYKSSGWYCKITIQVTFMTHLIDDLIEIIKLGARLGVDRIKGHQLWAHFDEIKNLNIMSDENSVEKWNHFIELAHDTVEKHLKPDGKKILLENFFQIKKTDQNSEQVPFDWDCPFLGKELWIAADGTINPCCAPDEHRKSLGYLGNISNTSLSQAINSNTYVELFKNYKKMTVCKSCNMRRPK